MTVRKLASGKWLVECYPNGRDKKRIRKTFTTKGEATAFEEHIISQHLNKAWLNDQEDKRTLSELVNIWFNSHGVTLSDGEKRKSAMLYICDCIGDPLAIAFTAKDFASYREKRLSGKLFRTERIQKVAPRTLNLELAYLKAMFNELIRIDEWIKNNPLEKVRHFRTDEQEMAFLTLEQIPLLLKECEKSKVEELPIIVKLCLATGGRWGEVESLTDKQARNNKITFLKTKGKKNRTVPISSELFNQLPQKKSRLFPSCYSAFLQALERSGIELPDGQKSHVLRHTFASYFMMNGGNILVLQRILGHSDIKMTMRYAHFAPNHFDEAIKLNPLSMI